MMNATFTAHKITVGDKTYPVEYDLTQAHTVFASVTVPNMDGKPMKVRIKIEHTDPNYFDALEAARDAIDEKVDALWELSEEAHDFHERWEYAMQAHELFMSTYWLDYDEHDDAITFENLTPAAIPAPKAEIMPARNQFVLVEPISVESIPETPAEHFSAKQPGETPADPKQARGPVPEKLFVGLEIKGKGWEIFFDGGHDRTRVIFKRKPVQAALDAVKKAGFFWSPAMKSWNKKLTHKAFRSAQALAVELRAICG